MEALPALPELEGRRSRHIAALPLAAPPPAKGVERRIALFVAVEHRGKAETAVEVIQCATGGYKLAESVASAARALSRARHTASEARPRVRARGAATQLI